MHRRIVVDWLLTHGFTRLKLRGGHVYYRSASVKVTLPAEGRKRSQTLSAEIVYSIRRQLKSVGYSPNF